ncbi:dihydrolipoyl dehydrogenase [Stutzerimonas kirkiae]|uniref:Dihydrolipoyl dehydrogenase n=1 Tax=Stutzerimonas kirkiae TaxID=2211392 RepID=A0A4Q9R4V0_9GAMM|nr:dihydrolipoyl dehydrogenase [Stutzerimonas kirkiae]TBU94030.1 dihydrolipoyl dehydrogenase [Stutzerimonas kirkiae]TBV06153.1 dihydrolipoyl dehydrogenase [Stutzerimonas kirkiae]TBV06595.1 dihydrolipoyl dehydrogenase [Stutzerimonas kirkiae]TBV13681.1 dihydrolipoyl dehydrogenase [Stutzerimonas kirkiae]
MSEKYDVLVIGGGPGGYVAAIRAGQLGLRTALVEKRHLGGICLNWGCIPTKALLHGAEVAHSIAHAGELGFSVGEVSFDLHKLVQFSRSVSQRLTSGVEYLLQKNGVTVLDGTARLRGKGQVVVDGEGGERDYRADHVILATGARPRPLPGIEADGERIWTYFEALLPKRLPKSLLIIGSGAIGVEFASLYNDLGSEVTLVELAGQILPVEDAEVSALVRKSFERRGIRVHTQAQVTAVQVSGEGVRCTLKGASGEQVLEVEHVLSAAGVQPNVEGLGLEALGVELERGFIKTDQACRTNVFGLYAIGDVAGPPCLAHKASHEGVICVESLAGVEGVHGLDRAHVPGCTYSRPQVASLGLTEAAARASGRPLKIGKFAYQANGKALASGEPEGFVKTIFDAESGELLGAHMVGAQVTEQIQGFGIAHALEATDDSLLSVIFAHPTLSEAMHESILAANGRALHQ